MTQLSLVESAETTSHNRGRRQLVMEKGKDFQCLYAPICLPSAPFVLIQTKLCIKCGWKQQQSIHFTLNVRLLLQQDVRSFVWWVRDWTVTLVQLNPQIYLTKPLHTWHLSINCSPDMACCCCEKLYKNPHIILHFMFFPILCDLQHVFPVTLTV